MPRTASYHTPSISILSDTLTPSLAKMKAITGDEWSEVLRPAARLLCVSLATQTQPYDKGKDAQEMGINAIRSDIYGKKSGGGIVIIWKDYMPATPSGPAGTKLWVGKDGHAYGVENNLFDLEGRQLAATHKKYRSRSTGRVSRAGQWDREVGRFVFIDKLVVKQDRIEKFIKKLGKLVGFAKGGWAVCARALGGTRGIPVWVAHQKSAGRVVDETANTDSPSITMINDVHYIHRCLSDRQVDRALEIAAGKLSLRADYLIKAKARHVGFEVH